MKPFTMQVEYLDAETGAMVTEDVSIDDMEAVPADPFAPEPDSNAEYPW